MHLQTRHFLDSGYEFRVCMGKMIPMTILTIDGDANEIAELLEFATSQLEWSQVPENKMVVRPRGLEFVSTANKLFTKGPCVSNDLLGICLPCRLGGLQECCSNASNGLDNPRLSCIHI